MGKLVKSNDGKFYRNRRGRMVEIPEEWVGRTPSKQTIRDRKKTRFDRDANLGYSDGISSHTGKHRHLKMQPGRRTARDRRDREAIEDSIYE